MTKLTKVTTERAAASPVTAITPNKPKMPTAKTAAIKRNVKSQPIPEASSLKNVKLPISKKQHLIERLKSSKGISMPELIKQSGWQAHSVRGFISGTVKKQLHYDVVTELNSSGDRIYRIVGGA